MGLKGTLQVFTLHWYVPSYEDLTGTEQLYGKAAQSLSVCDPFPHRPGLLEQRHQLPVLSHILAIPPDRWTVVRRLFNVVVCPWGNSPGSCSGRTVSAVELSSARRQK